MSTAAELSRLKALLFTTDAQVLSVMNQVLDNFEIDAEVCIDGASALDSVRTTKLDTLIMDWHDSHSAEILKVMRASEESGKSPVLALVKGDPEKQAATQAGANFTMYKPLNVDQATRFLRAAYGNILLQRRRAARCQVNIPVVAIADGAVAIDGQVIDLSVGGMAFRCRHDIHVDQHILIEFKLPDSPTTLHVAGQVANVIKLDTDTRVGICFSSVRRDEFAVLEQWLADRLPKLHEPQPSSQPRKPAS